MLTLLSVSTGPKPANLLDYDGSFNSTLFPRYCTLYCISWFECLRFLRGLCCAVLQIFTPHRTVHSITFAGPSSHNLSTMTSTYVLIITSPRARCCRGSTCSVRVQRVGCTTGICNSNEVGMSPAFCAATRCCGDAMRLQCYAAMRRRCDGDATAQTAMQPRRNRRGNRRRNWRSICRYFCKNTAG